MEKAYAADSLMVRKIDMEQAYVGGSSCLESLTYLDSMRRWMKWIKECTLLLSSC